MNLIWFGPLDNELPWPKWVSVTSTPSAAQLALQIRDSKVFAYILSSPKSVEQASQFIEQAKISGALAFPIVYQPKWDSDSIKNYYNACNGLGILWSGMTAKGLEAGLKNIEKQFDHRRGRIQELGSLREQSRQLEELQQNLLVSVDARTQDELSQKQQTQQRLLQMRQMVMFVKELSSCVAIEELFALLRREIKKFHKVSEPILSYRTSQRLRHLWYHGGQLKERVVQKLWPQNLRIRINEATDSQYLADEFARPFVKVIALPLPPILGHDVGNTAPAILYFEHTLAGAEVELFIAYVSERVQSLSIALDRMILEQDLKATSSLWEKTFDGFQDPIAIVDTDYNVLRANRSFSQFEGAQVCHKMFVGENKPCSGCPLPEVQQDSHQELSTIQKRGETFLVQTYPIRLSGHSTAHTMVNHYRNVTSEQRLQSQMIQTEKMAALGHLAGHVAHELNNPLTGIRSMAQVLRRDLRVSDEVKKDMEEVENAAERCQKIIQNLLSFAKGEAERKKVDINELIKRTLPFLKTALGEHQLHLELAQDPLYVEVEPHLLQQVFFNIINNACQAMGRGGELYIRSFHSQDLAKKTVCIAIRDTGPGIVDSVRERIFEPFFTTKKEREGTGLGLSLSQQIIQSYSGRINLASQLGKGSTFSILLPESVSKK